jgi:hypothetical protein
VERLGLTEFTIGYVQTTDVQTREEVNAAADLTSSVELHFRTDQVPLDRIASQQTVQRLQLNTLNPERELQIAAETDRARIGANQALETARAARPATPLAPTPTAAPPAPAAPASTRPPSPPMRAFQHQVERVSRERPIPPARRRPARRRRPAQARPLVQASPLVQRQERRQGLPLARARQPLQARRRELEWGRPPARARQPAQQWSVQAAPSIKPR